eukprot:6204517-Prymnesium_polylepis.2
MLRLLCLTLAAGHAAAYTLNSAARPLATPRCATPLAQFGTGNFKDETTDSFILSPVPGRAKNYKPTAEVEAREFNPLAIVAALFPLSIPVLFLSFLLVGAPGKQLPFSFLDRFYAPRVEELKSIKTKQDAAAAAAASKEKAAAKAKAEAEAKAKEAAAAAAAAAKAPAAAAK